MNLQIANTINSLKSLIPATYTQEEYQHFIELSIARAVAVNLQLPTSAVTSAESFFMGTPTHQAAEIVSQINEHFILNVGRVMKLVRSFYLLRYNLVYNAQALSASLAAAAAVETELLDATTTAVTAKLNNQEVRSALDTLVWSFAGDCNDGTLGVTGNAV